MIYWIILISINKKLVFIIIFSNVNQASYKCNAADF